MQHQWKNGINWAWFKSLIVAYKAKEISREKFLSDWHIAQETMKSFHKGGNE